MSLDNSLLSALAIVESIEPQLNGRTRSQISRNSLKSIQHSATEVLKRLQNIDLKETQITTYLLQVDSIINELVADDAFEATDTNVKDMLVDKVNKTLGLLYREAGEYYDTEHEFNYSPKLNALLERIIDECIKQGYYFGQQ